LTIKYIISQEDTDNDLNISYSNFNCDLQMFNFKLRGVTTIISIALRVHTYIHTYVEVYIIIVCLVVY